VRFEKFSKDDPNHDPILDYDFVNGVVYRFDARFPISPDTLIDTVAISDSPFAISEEQLEELARLTTDTFEVLEAAWTDQDVTLVDIKIE